MGASLSKLIVLHWVGFVDDNMPDTFVRNPFSGWIYERYAVVFHLPIYLYINVYATPPLVGDTWYGGIDGDLNF